VSESKQRTIVEVNKPAMSQEDSYWYWEEEPDVLSTQATVNRLMEQAKVNASQQEDYWKWDAQNDVLSGAAIERSLVLEQKRRANDAYWAWGQGDEVKYSLANAARCSAIAVNVEQEQSASYWVW